MKPVICFTDYKTVTKQIDGLKVYNARLQRQIDNQVIRIGEIDTAIDQVTVISRQITPLAIRMIDGLETFVELDALSPGRAYGAYRVPARQPRSV